MAKYALALAIALVLNATANLMVKVGSMRMKEMNLQLSEGLMPVITGVLSNWVLILGLVFFASNVVFYTYALSGIQISVAYPIMFCGGFAIIAVVSWKFLNEVLTTGQWIGVAAIVFGIIMVAKDMGVVRPGA